MKFCECLNDYIEKISCTGKELAKNSNISEAIISRYRNGERVPDADGEYLRNLAEGIGRTAAERGIGNIEAGAVLEKFQSLLTEKKSDGFISHKLDILIREMNINISVFADALHYDPSYISKIRTGKRKPAHQQEFLDCVCRYVAENCRSERESSILASLLNCKEDKIQQKENLQMILRQWLCSAEREEDYISGFLKKVDEFNLDDYIRIIHFDSLKVPKIPFQMPVSRHYYGLKEMREGELDFLKTAVLSKSMEPLYLCCDMPVEDMAEDQDFSKKYMFGLAMALKKGLHINIIHNVERPMKDMMLGLENWVPLYMTGQISPYYIKGVQNEIYGHLHYSAGTVAMTGECISGHHDMAHYYLTNNREEAAFYRKNAEFLLKKAKPLMEIYRDQQKLELEKFLEEDSRIPGRRRRILAAPPLFLLPEELLNRILDRCNVKAKREIKEYQEKEKQRMEKIFLHSRVTDELSEISEKEYAEHPVALPVAGCFLEENILLNYEEYRACAEAAEKYAKKQEAYEFVSARVGGFRNIQINCHVGKWCMVSKNKAPSIHFVIYHPKLRHALENVYLPIRDEEPEQEDTDWTDIK